MPPHEQGPAGSDPEVFQTDFSPGIFLRFALCSLRYAILNEACMNCP